MTVLLFGPQALTFNQQSFQKLRSAITGRVDLAWISAAIHELPSHWVALTRHFPQLVSLPGERFLGDLQRAFETGDHSSIDFRLPNIILTPLVVATQLVQYSRYLDLKYPNKEQAQDLQASFARQNATTVGFCTGLLSALAVSSSHTKEDLELYGATAIRLAALIGALVDAQDGSDRSHGRAKSFATAWNTSDQGSELARIIDQFPEVSIYWRSGLLDQF